MKSRSALMVIRPEKNNFKLHYLPYWEHSVQEGTLKRWKRKGALRLPKRAKIRKAI